MKIQLKEFEVLESTNVTAVAEAKAGAGEGTVIVAQKQEGGHGRMKRVWSSPLGGLWFSIILRPKIEPQFAAQVTLLAGIAVTKALRRLYETDAIRIKWPNDILLKDKKICGILSEMNLDENGNIDYAVIGIGVNVAIDMAKLPEELSATAASLNASLGKKYSCNQVLVAILAELQLLYKEWLQKGAVAIMPQWKHFNCTLGKDVLVKDNDKVIFSGKAIDVDEEGALIVANTNGEQQRFNFGEISIRY